MFVLVFRFSNNTNILKSGSIKNPKLMQVANKLHGNMPLHKAMQWLFLVVVVTCNILLEFTYKSMWKGIITILATHIFRVLVMMEYYIIVNIASTNL